MSRYYDRHGNPIDVMTFSRLYEDRDYQSLRNDYIQDRDNRRIHVSTVWLGINHNFGQGMPLIFETMIFGGEHDEEQWRYSTETEAIEGHQRAIALVRKAAR